MAAKTVLGISSAILNDIIINKTLASENSYSVRPLPRIYSKFPATSSPAINDTLPISENSNKKVDTLERQR